MEKKCEYCLRVFRPDRVTRKYCSDTCKQYAYLERHGMNRNPQRVQGINERQESVNDHPSVIDGNYGNDATSHYRLIQEETTAIRNELKGIKPVTVIHPVNDHNLPVQERLRPIRQKRRPIYLQLLHQRTVRSIFGSRLFSPERLNRLTHQQREAVMWLNERLKSYVSTLLSIGKKRQTGLREVQHIAKELEYLVSSYSFTLLTDREYPFCDEVVEWSNTLKRYVERLARDGKESFRLILSREQQVDLKTIIYHIGQSVPDVDHGTPSAATSDKASNRRAEVGKIMRSMGRNYNG